MTYKEQISDHLTERGWSSFDIERLHHEVGRHTLVSSVELLLVLETQHEIEEDIKHREEHRADIVKESREHILKRFGVIQ